jgi:hypothetical protein
MSHPPPPPQDPGAEACPRCGVIDRPSLGPGRGPHACEAFCAHCGKHLRWVSLLAPSEREARRAKAKLEAMSKKSPSEKQLQLLRDLGDTEAPPANMAQASERIGRLKGA